ncbi:MAG: nitroreductase family deazaflavin-dependent oxidoreductase [Nocardiaceae bacterium]|nr:nitroreductase family deazaflavin-dependent oxidoreductase [Nocardiaceae bacterium]
MSELRFPDVRWGSPDGVFRRAFQPVAVAFLSSRLGGWIHRRLRWLDLALLRATRGRVSMFGPSGIYVLVLTTTGRRSGNSHSVPLVYVPHEGGALVLGSNYGQAHHPAWSANLLADPRASVEVGGHKFAVLAEHITGTRFDDLFRQFLAIGENFGTYRERSQRDLRMFALRRV